MVSLPEQSWLRIGNRKKFDKIVANLPLQRAGNPSDIAQAVLFLLEATYITGYILPVDGGWSIT